MASPSFERIVNRAPSSHEDRLTEILALVLEVSPELNSQIACAMAGAARTQDWEVETQYSIAAGSKRRVDLVLESSAASHVIWVEAKLDARESGEDQLDHYYEALRDTEGHRTKSLVYLTKEGGSAWRIRQLKEKHDPDGTGSVELFPFDWQQMSAILGKSGALAGALNRYLNSEGAIVKPISHGTVVVAKDFVPAHNSVKQLLETISNQVDVVIDLPKFEHWPRSNMWNDFPKWFRTYEIEGWETVTEKPLLLEWTLRILDEDLDLRGNGEPAFCWGLTLKEARFKDVAPELLESMQVLDPGYENFVDDDCDRIFKVKPLGDIDFRQSLEEQASGMSQIISKDLKESLRVAQEWIEERFEGQAELGA